MPESPLKIALVSEHASPLASIGGRDAGGQNVYVRALALTLGSLGHQVTVYTRRTAVDQVSTELAPGVRIEHIPAGPSADLPKEDLAPFMGDFGTHLANRWQRDPPDIVHAHYWMSGIAALAGVRRTRIPVVQTFHALAADKIRFQGGTGASPERERERERAGSEQSIGQIVDAVIALTAQEADDLTLLGVPRDRITTIPCGVDLETFSPHGPIAIPRNDRPRLLIVGRLVVRKGLDTVIEALTHLPDTELLIAGGPPHDQLDADPEVGKLRALASELGVHERVEFLGRIPHPQVPALLRSADVFVCTPSYEPFGMAALEASACGRPVVASDVGGLRETVIEGVTGHLVPPAQPALLAARLAPLLTDPQTRRTMGQAGAERSKRYSWNQVTRSTLDVYLGLTSRRN